MNRENILKAIAIMRRVPAGKLDMHDWQEIDMRRTLASTSERELHACGNAACFAGWVAVSPEFNADGGRAGKYSGIPVFEGSTGPRALSLWLGISHELARKLTIGVRPDDTPFCLFYGKLWSEVTPEDVIEKLEALL